MIPEFFQFYLPTKILFQAGISKDFSNELSEFGISKILFLTDSYWVKQPQTQEILQGLKNAGIESIEIFSEIPPNSEVKVVKRAAEQGIQAGAEAIVALGGGSVLDTAKAANILLSQGGDLVSDYSGAQTLTKALKPLIAIPTTSGTGSEVTKAAVILDEENSAKLSFVDRYLYPTLAILDPELTLSMPPQLTAMTGMDALTHAIEAYTSLEQNAFAQALSLRAIQLIHQYLLKAVKQGDDLEARSAMMAASNLAGVAFDHSMVGVVHSMSHAVGAISHVPHGLANSILLPWGMEYNFEVAHEKYADLLNVLEISFEGSREDKARKAIEEVRKMRSNLKNICGLSDRLSEAGVQEKDLEAIADLAEADGSSFYNPREVTATEVLSSLKKAF